MARGQSFAILLTLSLLMNAMCLPQNAMFRRERNLSDNTVDSDFQDSAITADVATETKEISDNNGLLASESNQALTKERDSDDDDDFDDDDFKPSSSSGGGSSIFSLLNLATAVLPSLSGSNNVKNNNEIVKKVIKEVIRRYQVRTIQKRQDVGDNVIEIDYASDLKPPVFERQESEENDSDASESNSDESNENNGGEESVEEVSNEKEGSKSKQDSQSNASNANDSDGSDNDSDYDEPEGDGQGGGILGLLAGLSGDGESDLGSLLATVGGIVANLSGDGIDLNAIIATGLGLFVGLLSDEGTNPGEVIGSYLLTSLNTITGGGAQNNGAFFGRFLSTLVKGTSAAGDGTSGSEENGGMKMTDSAGFLFSLLMGLLGDMSKQSSSSSWR